MLRKPLPNLKNISAEDVFANFSKSSEDDAEETGDDKS